MNAKQDIVIVKMLKSYHQTAAERHTIERGKGGVEAGGGYRLRSQVSLLVVLLALII